MDGLSLNLIGPSQSNRQNELKLLIDVLKQQTFFNLNRQLVIHFTSYLSLFLIKIIRLKLSMDPKRHFTAHPIHNT